ncbi:MAG: hypothetical protein WCG27_04455 [Pseudomonadota bacterium]
MDILGFSHTRCGTFQYEQSECDEEDEQRRAPDRVASTEDHDDISADDDDDAESSIGKKRKAPNKKRVFVPQKTWDLDEHDSADVHAAIRVELGQINTQAGLSKVKTLQHQDRNNIYGDWIFALHWISGSRSISNKVFMCPLVAFGAGPRSLSRIPMMLHHWQSFFPRPHQVGTGFQSSWSLLHRLDFDTGIHVCLTANHLHRMKMILFVSI